MPRQVEVRYSDPLDDIWRTTAERLGLTLDETPAAYATTDGKGRLSIGSRETLDADDCVAQMVFHEICHWMTQGVDAVHLLDWGLDNETPRDTEREHACLRAQAYLSEPYGLRTFFAPTTDYREFYDSLGADPLAPRDTESSELAVQAVLRSRKKPFAPHLTEALRATADIVSRARNFALPGTLLARARLPWPEHPRLDHVATARFGEASRCGTCAFGRAQGKRLVCMQTESTTRAEWPACERYETALDCQACGACCREAFQAVEISKRDTLHKTHPALVVVHEGRHGIKRSGPRCAALTGDGLTAAYACSIYEDRPKPCREFEQGSRNCLAARRRVGLSV